MTSPATRRCWVGSSDSVSFPRGAPNTKIKTSVHFVVLVSVEAFFSFFSQEEKVKWMGDALGDSSVTVSTNLWKNSYGNAINLNSFLLTFRVYCNYFKVQTPVG